MNIDPNALPAECWVIDREMVRAGRLPRRIVPKSAHLYAEKTVAGVCEGKRDTYHSVGSLHATEAYAWAERCAGAFKSYSNRARELRAQATTNEDKPA